MPDNSPRELRITLEASDLIETVLELQAEIDARPSLPEHLQKRIDAIGLGGTVDVVSMEGLSVTAGPELLAILAAVRAQP
jgi:hypothetical protein